jgi:hypothetical protein
MITGNDATTPTTTAALTSETTISYHGPFCGRLQRLLKLLRLVSNSDYVDGGFGLGRSVTSFFVLLLRG